MIYMEEPIENKIWLIGWMTSLSKIGNPIIEIWKRAPLQSFLLTRLPAELPLQTGSVRFRTRALDRKQRLCEHGYYRRSIITNVEGDGDTAVSEAVTGLTDTITAWENYGQTQPAQNPATSLLSSLSPLLRPGRGKLILSVRLELIGCFL